MSYPKTPLESASVRIINLRKTLELANDLLKARGAVLLPMCDETQTPSFRGGRKFWSEVRKLAKDMEEDFPYQGGR